MVKEDSGTPGSPARAEAPDFRLLFESLPGLYLVLNPDLTIVAVTDAYAEATLVTREAILGRGIFDVFPNNPADPAATGVRNLQDSLERVLRHRVPDAMAVQKYDIRRSEADPAFEERYWSPLNVPVFGPDGAIRYILHRAEDVTDFVRLKDHEAEQNEIARSLEQRSKQMEVEVFRRAQEIQEANRQLREARNLLEGRVHSRTVELAEANEALRAEFAQSRQLEQQLRQAQKMEAVGTLAGGVAHDFNNILTVISGYSELLCNNPALPESERGFAQEIHNAGLRAAALTKQLLLLSRHKVVELVVLDLNSIVIEAELMLRRLIGEHITVRTVLSPNLGRVKADRGQIEQVIMNLAVNARDAMPTGGTLTIESANVQLDETFARGHLEVAPGQYVRLAVSDSGAGMDEQTKARIFEPFFTTKPAGKGSGLGLSIVFGIIRQCGGSIWVYSEVGRGTTFKIYLPRAEDEDGPPPGIESHRPTGDETLLLVEDEPSLRTFTTFALQTLGYHVLAAANGAEAIQTAESYAGPIQLLVSDVVMPEMSGRKAADAIKAFRPTIKVLFLSGYTDDTVVQHGVLHEQMGFLQKPYSIDGLAMKVRSVLDSAKNAAPGEERPH